jgi:hypothetical protein
MHVKKVRPCNPHAHGDPRRKQGKGKGKEARVSVRVRCHKSTRRICRHAPNPRLPGPRRFSPNNEGQMDVHGSGHGVREKCAFGTTMEFVIPHLTRGYRLGSRQRATAAGRARSGPRGASPQPSCALPGDGCSSVEEATRFRVTCGARTPVRDR